MSRIVSSCSAVKASCLLLGLGIVLVLAGDSLRTHYAPVSEAVVGRIVGATGTQTLWAPNTPCAYGSFPAGTLVDCSGWSNGTACSTCAGSPVPWVAKSGSSGGSSDAAQSFFNCNTLVKASGKCTWGYCGGTPTENACINQQLQQYTNEL